jgi:hypothetical protein
MTLDDLRRAYTHYGSLKRTAAALGLSEGTLFNRLYPEKYARALKRKRLAWEIAHPPKYKRRKK